MCVFPAHRYTAAAIGAAVRQCAISAAARSTRLVPHRPHSGARGHGTMLLRARQDGWLHTRTFRVVTPLPWLWPARPSRSPFRLPFPCSPACQPGHPAPRLALSGARWTCSACRRQAGRGTSGGASERFERFGGGSRVMQFCLRASGAYVCGSGRRSGAARRHC